MESGGQKGELSLPHHSVNTCCNRKGCTWHLQQKVALLPAGGRKNSPCLATAQLLRDCCNSPVKSHYTSNSQFHRMDFLFIVAPPPSFSSLLFYQTCMWFTVSAYLKLQFFTVPNYNCLDGKQLGVLFQVKPPTWIEKKKLSCRKRRISQVQRGELIACLLMAFQFFLSVLFWDLVEFLTLGSMRCPYPYNYKIHFWFLLKVALVVFCHTYLKYFNKYVIQLWLIE